MRRRLPKICRRKLSSVAAGSSCAADEVEDLAVLHAIIGDALHAPLGIEIDRQDALIDDLRIEEGGLSFGALRNVIEDFAADCGDGRGRAENEQHLLLTCADRNLIEGRLVEDIAALIGSGEATRGEQRKAGNRSGRADAGGSLPRAR
jgi:hypothetical protein